MRQILSVRFVAALAALLGLTLAVQTVFADDDADLVVIEEVEAPNRRVDLISIVETVRRSPDFIINEAGVTDGFLDAEFADGRVMRVAPGTPGEITCPNLRLPNRCVVFADLVGDAVLWFALLPKGPNNTVLLPPILDLEEGFAVFENGWEIRYPPVIERICTDDITSFSDFLRRYGPNSTSIVDIETQVVSAVRCGEEVRPDAVPDLLDDPFQPVAG
ncbi:MAG: hypothetical protein AAFP84_00840 [Actinomycetota bacterium]